MAFECQFLIGFPLPFWHFSIVNIKRTKKMKLFRKKNNARTHHAVLVFFSALFYNLIYVPFFKRQSHARALSQNFRTFPERREN